MKTRKLGRLLHERDGRQGATIVRLAILAGAAIAEKALLLPEGVTRKRVNVLHSSLNEPSRYIALEVEKQAIALTRAEKTAVRFSLGQKWRWKLRPDFIGALADAGSDGCQDLAASRSQALHGCNGRFNDTSQRTLPPGMSRTDYAGTMIGQQQGRAICRKNPNRQPGSARYESVGAWPLLLLPGLLD